MGRKRFETSYKLFVSRSFTYAQMHVGYRQKIASFSDGKFIQIYEVKELVLRV